MFRFAIVIAGLLWASLLLISWSAPPSPPPIAAQIQTSLPTPLR